MNRARQCRPESRRARLTLALRSDNCAWRLMARGIGVALVVSGSAGCSLSFPIGGFRSDDAATGSIDRSAKLLSPTLDREDWRRARAALSVALDPQGNGRGVNWRNPQTGAKGSFVALASPFVDHDHICRAFDADISPGSGSERHLSGSACRESDGDWELRDAKEAGKA